MDTLTSSLLPENAVRSASGHTWLDDEGILIAVAVPQALHTLDDALENHKINLQLSGGIPRPFLIDISRVRSMSKEARNFYAGTEPKKAITAVAIVNNSNIGKVVANFFLQLTRQELPTRMFTDINEAKDWLHQFRVNAS